MVIQKCILSKKIIGDMLIQLDQEHLIKSFIAALMDSADEITGPFNLGNPNEFTILELAQKIIDITGSSSKIVSKPLPIDDPKQRQPDISLAKEKLNWQPQVQLEEGLKPTIAYFDAFLKNSS
jgi:UDP-glucuronate decarboxylase